MIYCLFEGVGNVENFKIYNKNIIICMLCFEEFIFKMMNLVNFNVIEIICNFFLFI